MPRLIPIDDESEFRAYVTEVAGDMGFDVVATGDGTVFREACRSGAPDLILLDIVMPDEDGVELLNWLGRESYRGRVMIVSGYDPQYSKIACTIAAKKGMTVSSMPKPIRLADLRRQLASFCEAGNGMAGSPR